MEDVDAKPSPPPASQLATGKMDPSSMNDIDGWIEGLMECKQLSEQDVQKLCDKVLLTAFPLGTAGGP